MRITGFEPEELLGRACAENENILVHVDGCGTQLCENGCPLTNVVGRGRIGTLEIFLRHRDGHRVPVLVRAAPVHDDASNIVGAIEIFSSKVTAVDQIHELERPAFIDPLTELPKKTASGVGPSR